jgi:predicted dehydrogenase
MSRIKIGAIGSGYWGPNLIRNFIEMPDTKVAGVADLDPARLAAVRTRFPQIGTLTTDYRDLFDMGLDAVVVSTPPETHAAIVADCLEHDLAVLVEKPLATDTDSALRMKELAEERGLVLMVGHTFEFNPAVRMLKAMIDDRIAGDIRYIDAVRVGLGLFHPTLNVVWDLAPHDISILIHLLEEMPMAVSTRGVACVQDGIEDVAYMTLTFPSGILAHVRLSWLDPMKTRRLTVVGSRKMIVYDDVALDEKIRLYDKRVDAMPRTDTFGAFQFAYHHGGIEIPPIDFQEPLRIECHHFVECIRAGTRPLTDADNGIRVVRVIEAAQESLSLGGIPVEVMAVRDRESMRAAAAGSLSEAVRRL